MKARSKIAILVTMSLLLIPINIVSAKDNIPNTTLEDVDKTSPCEVTADIHYAYYVSLPASLTLEPYDSAKHYDKMIELLPNFDKPIDSGRNGSRYYVCPYLIKAKTKTEGLNGKYIRVFPVENEQEMRKFFYNKGLAYSRELGF